MKESLKLILVLTVIAVLTGALLALANLLTENQIAEARRAELLQALNFVLPPHDNEPDREKTTLYDNGREHIFYPARKKGKFAGTAFTIGKTGYAGVVTVLVGITADDRIHAVRILSQSETPGLGANIARPAFTRQFAGQNTEHPEKLAIRQDDGDIHAVTAATISSRAVADAVITGLKIYQAHREQIRAAPGSTQVEQPSPPEKAEEESETDHKNGETPS